MPVSKVLMIGGSGFVGRCLTGRLAARGIEVTLPTRRLERAKPVAMLPTVRPLAADVHDPQVLRELVAEADAVINLVGILHDRDSSHPYGRRFAAAHAELPARIVAAMRATGVRRLLHMSALAAAPDAPSSYLRSKAAGEAAVLAAENDLQVTVFRPSVIFGPEDAFLNTFAGLLSALPCLPLAGCAARFQPVYVGDVAAAFIAALDDAQTIGKTYELCGPQTYTLRQLVVYVRTQLGVRCPVICLPAPLARLQAELLGRLPRPPMSPDNLRSMQVDSVSDGLHDFPGWRPQALAALAPAYLSARRRR